MAPVTRWTRVSRVASSALACFLWTGLVHAQTAGEQVGRVADIVAGSGGSSPSAAVAVGSLLYFSACTTAEGCELWKSDGTAVGTVLVKDIRAGSASSSPSSITAVGSSIYFTADAGSGPSLWKSDGTSGGTTQIVAAAANTTISELTAFGSRLAYVRSRPQTGFLDLASVDLSLTDGSATQSVYAASESSCSCSISAVTMVEQPRGVSGAALRSLYWFYSGKQSQYTGNKSDYFFRWVEGAASPEIAGTFGGFPGSMKALGSSLVAGDDSRFRFVEAKAQTFDFPGRATALTVVGGRVFFSSTAWGGAEPAIADVSGAFIIKDLYPGSTASSPTSFAPLGAGVAFAAEEPTRGRELWISDGTSAGTFAIDINPGTSGSSPTGLVNVGGRVYFSADDGTSGRELWRTDGTTAGTVRVRDLNPGAGSSNPTDLVNLNGKLYFSADDGTSGIELWNAEATVKVRWAISR